MVSSWQVSERAARIGGLAGWLPRPTRTAMITAMRPSDSASDLDQLLAEQMAYYRAIAPEYEDHALPFEGGNELSGALDAFQPSGSVLELACGQGLWTRQLVRYATDVTAVDASPEMLEIASTRINDECVRFIEADIFHWEPDRRYDVVFFGFWLSHVPLERFTSFWTLVENCLKSDGRAFFVDDGYRTPEELIEGELSSTILRRLNDGTAHRAVKVPHRADVLEERLAKAGWRVKVTTTGPFYWGAGSRA
jgi:2-polyprenyl-3-methyl-5-hydroxy-6-metoxy-1,4-benzoquinol methylase